MWTYVIENPSIGAGSRSTVRVELPPSQYAARLPAGWRIVSSAEGSTTTPAAPPLSDDSSAMLLALGGLALLYWLFRR
jgi:hypothetical protein